MPQNPSPSHLSKHFEIQTGDKEVHAISFFTVLCEIIH